MFQTHLKLAFKKFQTVHVLTEPLGLSWVLNFEINFKIDVTTYGCGRSRTGKALEMDYKVYNGVAVVFLWVWWMTFPCIIKLNSDPNVMADTFCLRCG
jgi:hypothetical protein